MMKAHKGWLSRSVSTAALVIAVSAAVGQAKAQVVNDSSQQTSEQDNGGSTTTDAPIVGTDATGQPAITVIGTRLGLGSATDVKQHALQSVSILTAADIEKIPDTSLADVVRRIPGVAIDESGGGGIITIRGLSDTEDRVNGRNLTSTVGRGYDIAALPADLVSGVDVYKTPSASQIEGGIGGVIDIHTRRPFDFDGFAAGVTAKEGYATLAGKGKPYLSGFVSDRWDTPVGEIGLLAGGAYQRQLTTQNVSRVDSNVDTTDGAGHSVSAPSDIVKQQGVGTGGKTLTTGYASAQWRPTDTLEFTGDFLYNNEGLNFTTQSLTAQLSGGTPVGAFQTASGGNAATAGSYSNVPVKSATSQGVGYFRTYQAGAGGRYHHDNLTLSGDYSYTKTIFRYQAPTVTISAVAPEVNFNTASQVPSFTVSGVNPTNAGSYTYSDYNDFVDRDSSTERAYRADAIYEIGGALKNLQVGMRYDQRGVTHQQNFLDVTPPAGVVATPGSLVGITNDSLFGSGYPQPQWATPENVYANNAAFQTISGFPVGRPAYDPFQGYDASEKVLSGYAQLTFGFPLAGIPIDGNVGVRVARTKLDVTGFETLNGVHTPIDARQQFTDPLPMVNVRAELAKGLYLRLAYSKQITRAPFYELNPSITLSSITATGSGGNPNLKPLRADQYDGALEWYFGKSNMLYASGFYKDVTGYIRTETDVETIDGRSYLISRPENVAQSWIAGFELGYQHKFTFLPGLLSGLGVSGSYTYVDDKRTNNGSGYRVGLEQLSKSNYSAALTYDRDNVSANIAYTHRSRILEATTGDGDGRPLYHAPYGQLDVNVSYAVTPRFSLLVNGVNLTQNQQTEYFNSRSYFNNTFIEDRRVFIGAQIKLGALSR